MTKAYLFIESLREQDAISVGFSDDGRVEHLPTRRTFEDYRTMLEDGESIVVLPAHQASIFTLVLPKLSHSQAQNAILYALEEQIASPLDEVHVAFHTVSNTPHTYEVVVIQKKYLEEIFAQLESNNIPFTSMTLDCFALKPNELIMMPDSVLFSADHQKGGLLSVFKAECPDLPLTKEFKKLDKAYLWLAQRLQKESSLNLCVGPFALKTKYAPIQKTYFLAAGFAVLSLMFYILSHSWSLFHLHREIKHYDAKISKIYYQFFPNASQIINPRFRVGQLIQTSPQGGASALWEIFSKLDVSFNAKLYSLKELRWRPNVLTLSLTSPDFAALEKLESALKKQGLNVTQTQSTTKQELVYSTLELRL